MTRTFRSHCSSWGAHFSGDGSLDLHRVGSFRVPDDHFNARRCLDPREDSRFADVTGECRISDPDAPRAPVAIWGLARRRQGSPLEGTGAEPQTLTGGILSGV